MTRQLRIRIVWATLIAALFVGGYVIVRRHGPATVEAAPSGYFH